MWVRWGYWYAITPQITKIALPVGRVVRRKALSLQRGIQKGE